MQGGGIFLLRRVKGERKNLLKILVWNSTAAKPPTGRFCWTVHDGSLLGPFSLTKRAMHEQGNWTKFNFVSRKYRAKFCREIKRDLALDDKVFRALRRSTKGAAFGNRSLLKKAGENFMFLQPLLQPPRSVKFFLCLLSFFTKKKVRCLEGKLFSKFPLKPKAS